MICRQSRDRLALMLRRYAAGRISNDELNDVAVNWRDRGAVAVKEMAWTLYDDMAYHYATGKYALSDDVKRFVAQCVVFLHSESEYLWPEYSFIQIVNWPLNLLTFGWWERHKSRRRKEFEEAGDYSAWPFVRTADLHDAARSPRYLVGRQQRWRQEL